MLSSITKALLTHTLASFWRKQFCSYSYSSYSYYRNGDWCQNIFFNSTHEIQPMCDPQGRTREQIDYVTTKFDCKEPSFWLYLLPLEWCTIRGCLFNNLFKLIEKDIKAPHYRPFVRKSTGHGELPSQRASNALVFIPWRQHHMYLVIVGRSPPSFWQLSSASCHHIRVSGKTR